MFNFFVERRAIFFWAIVIFLGDFFVLNAMDEPDDVTHLSDETLADRWARLNHKLLNDVLSLPDKENCEMAFRTSDQEQEKVCNSKIGIACQALEKKAGSLLGFIDQLKSNEDLTPEGKEMRFLASNLDACQIRDSLLIEFAARQKSRYLVGLQSENFLKSLSEDGLSQRISEATQHLVESLFSPADRQSYEFELMKSGQAGESFFQKKLDSVCEAFYQNSVQLFFPDKVSMELFYFKVARKNLKGEPLDSDEQAKFSMLENFFMCQVAAVGTDILKNLKDLQIKERQARRFQAKRKASRAARERCNTRSKNFKRMNKFENKLLSN